MNDFNVQLEPSCYCQSDLDDEELREERLSELRRRKHYRVGLDFESLEDE